MKNKKNKTHKEEQTNRMRISPPKFLIGLFMFVLLLSSAFATQWFEDFEDQPISNGVFIEDTGITAWNITATSNSADYHGIQTQLGTKTLYHNDVDSTFVSEIINASDAVGMIDISFIVSVIDKTDKFGGNDEIKAFIRPLGSIPILGAEIELSSIDKNGDFEVGHIVSFETSYTEFQLEIHTESDDNDTHVIIDNILIEWLNSSESASDNTVDVTNNFNATINANSNLTTFINNTVIVNSYFIPDNSTIQLALGTVCPFWEEVSNSQRWIYLILAVITILTLFSGFIFNNIFLEFFSILTSLYLCFASVPCDKFLAGFWLMMFLASFVGFIWSMLTGKYTRQMLKNVGDMFQPR